MQSAYQQAGNNFVAHTQHQRAIEHIMAQRNGGGHGDGIAGEQAEFHAGVTLRNAVAHRRHAACHLGAGAMAAGLVFDQVGVMLQRRVRRQHVVEGVDDANMRRTRTLPLHHDANGVQAAGAALVGRVHGRESMGHIGATHALRTGRSRRHGGKLGQISAAGGRAALHDALRDGGHGGVKRR